MRPTDVELLRPFLNSNPCFKNETSKKFVVKCVLLICFACEFRSVYPHARKCMSECSMLHNFECIGEGVGNGGGCGVCECLLLLYGKDECQCKCTHSGSCHFVSAQKVCSCFDSTFCCCCHVCIRGEKQQLTSTSFCFEI